ncbi:ABC transporter substrate-binding protein [Paenibacillus chartarius]|uniref:ABC transporter substrate-binding protein n=1 Tax=Paenibacillus chartarius TaxID=747481 RepID=A0ABV6DNB3_9BACL
MTNKWKHVALCSILTVLPLTACSSNSNSAAGSDAASPQGKNGKTTVTVSALKKDAFLQEAERLFEEANPDIDIDIRGYLATPESDNKKMVMRSLEGDKPNEADLEKFRTSVNAELMSGKGADLIALEHLPYEKYARKHLLARLDDWIKKDGGLKDSDYYTSIFDAVRVDGTAFALPIHYTMNATLGNTPLLEAQGIQIDDSKWTWKDMLAIGRQVVQSGGNAAAVWTGKPKADLIGDMVQSQYSQYVSGKKAAFDTAEFTELLEQVSDMYDKGQILETADMSNASKDIFKSLSMQMPMNLLFMPQMMYGGKGKVYNTPAENGNGSGISFTSNLMLGINEKSKHKEEAWKFLQFLLSEKVQSAPWLQGFPVHKASLEKQLRQSIEALSSGRIKLQGPNGTGPSAAITEEQLQSSLALADRKASYAAGDPTVMKIVKEEAQAFFNKTKSAKAAAGMIQNRVTTYLNE